jgi:molybdopterin-guanine dinucleotide biosynthesis protein B
MANAPRTVPIVSVVGKGDSGKTTFLEKLIRELSDRGIRVATVKHHIHDYDIDVPGKDSYRHARAGAFATMVSSPEKFALIHDVEAEKPLDDIAVAAAEVGADLLITEGYKHEGRNRIEISRVGRSSTLICASAEMTALVTDNPALSAEVDAAGVPVFDLNAGVSGVADLIVERFLPDAEGEVRGGGATRSSAGAKRRGLSEHGTPASDSPSASGSDRDAGAAHGD